MKKAMKQSTMTYLLNISSILILIGIAVVFIAVSRMNDRIAEANHDRILLTQNANRFMDGSAYLTNEVRSYAATGDKRHYDNYLNEAENLQNTVVGVEDMKAIGITPAEQKAVDEMLEISNRLIPLEESAMRDVEAGNMRAAIDYVYGAEYETSIGKIESLQKDFLAMLDVRTQGEVDRLMATDKILEGVTFILILLLVAVQCFTCLVMCKKVLRPIAAVEREMGEIAKGSLSSVFTLEPDTSEIGLLVNAIHKTRATLREYIGDISEKLSQIAGGNLDLTADTPYKGDFAPIQQALEIILSSLNQTLRQIHIAAEQVGAGSEQVSSGAQGLASGSTEQAASIEELSSAVAEVSRQAAENLSSIEAAAGHIDRAGSGVGAGNRHMEQLTEAMSEISASSGRIANITKVIEDIAFQTNILALNAAIEAARAGTAGKGFAVVAEEVRHLAAKSGEAAKQTAELIGHSVATVEKGSEIAAKTAQILQEVGVNAQKTTESFRSVEQASAEQTHAIRMIVEGLGQVSAVVQTNAATAEENSATSEELSAQSATLREAVRKFTLREEEKLSHAASFLSDFSPAREQPGLLPAGRAELGKY